LCSGFDGRKGRASEFLHENFHEVPLSSKNIY
jgi:hypothetical protein